MKLVARDNQSEKIAASLKADGIEVLPEAEIVALIAYLQRLGTDIKGEKTATTENNP
jgi:cytochrome c oxidase cbb3-type subunit I/II